MKLMFTVIGIMFLGIGVGYLMRRQSLSWINKAITALIWLLLFLLGIEVGHNEQIIRSLPTLGVEALAIALVCVLVVHIKSFWDFPFFTLVNINV